MLPLMCRHRNIMSYRDLTADLNEIFYTVYRDSQIPSPYSPSIPYMNYKPYISKIYNMDQFDQGKTFGLSPQKLV